MYRPLFSLRRAFVCAALAALVAPAWSQAAPVKIRVGVQPVMLSSLWNALASGLFAKNGVDVEMVTFTTGPAQTAALKGGVIDVAFGAATTFYAIRSGGAPIQWVATIGDFNRNDAMVGYPSRGIRTAADLKGKKIALPFYTVVHAPLLAWLSAHGVKGTDVDLVNLAPPQALAALNNGAVDAMYAWPPFTTEVQSRGGVILTTPKDAPGGGWSWDGFAANQDWAEKNETTLARFLKALDEGRKTIRENRDAIIKTAVQVTGMPLSTAQTTFSLVAYPPLADNLTPGNPISMCSPELGKGLAATLMQARDFYTRSGQIVHAAKFSDFLNPRALSVALGIKCPRS